MSSKRQIDIPTHLRTMYEAFMIHANSMNSNMFALDDQWRVPFRLWDAN